METFIKVYIKSDADLQHLKWGESYSIKMKNGVFFEKMGYNQMQNKAWFLTYVNWYLLPVKEGNVEAYASQRDTELKEEDGMFMITDEGPSPLGEGKGAEEIVSAEEFYDDIEFINRHKTLNSREQMKKVEKIYWTIFIICLMANLINIYLCITTENYFMNFGKALMLMMVSMFGLEAIGAIILIWKNKI